MQEWYYFKDFFLHDRFDKLFENIQPQIKGAELPVWNPRVDIYETDYGFVVKAEIPDVKQTDINIKIEGRVININGVRGLETEGRHYHQIERSYGYFSRIFSLTEEVDEDDVRVMLRDGILKILLLKKKEGIPKYIKIEEIE